MIKRFEPFIDSSILTSLKITQVKQVLQFFSVSQV